MSARSNHPEGLMACAGLLTNRLLWLSASARAVSLRGSGCRNLALRALVNKPRFHWLSGTLSI